MADDQRLADILSILSSIDARLPKRRVKSAAVVPSTVEPDVALAERPTSKRVRKPSAKAAAAAVKLDEPQLEEDDEPAPPAKPARKPRAKKAPATAVSE